jgi:putative transcriptional regulator
MAIAVKLEDLLHDRRMTLTELSDRIGLTLANLPYDRRGTRGRQERNSSGVFF